MIPKTGLAKFSIYLVFFALCVLIGFISYHIYRYFNYVYDYNNEHQRLIGFQNKDEVVKVFDPLMRELVRNRQANLSQLPSELNNDTGKVDERIFTPQDETEGTGIPYLTFPPFTVNYGASFFPVKNMSAPSSTSSAMKDTIEKGKQKTEAERQKTDLEKQKDLQIQKDKFVSAKLLKDLIDSCKIEKCKDYDKYNSQMWTKLFGNISSKNLGIGKIYVVSKDSLAVFPYQTINSFSFEKSDWWKAANGDDSERDLYNSSTNVKEIKESGVTIIYRDIVKEHNITDLTRTIWFKFEKYDKDYIFAVDIRLKPEKFDLWSSYFLAELTLLPLFLITLLVLIYFDGGIAQDIPKTSSLVYKLKRIERQKSAYRANQRNEYKLTFTTSIRNTEENIARIKASNILSFDTKVVGSKLEKVDESVDGKTKTELVEIKVEKTLDLSLKSGNLKAFELWKIFHPTNEKYVLGLIEVLWQNNRSENEITCEKYFWDSNTSASFDLIAKELKKQLHTTENDTLLFDQGSQLDIKADIVGILKDKLPYIKDFATKSESFNNRVLLFDDNAPILKQLYLAANSHIFATCSMEFLDYLRNEDKLQEILSLPLENRFIIDGEKRKFNDFYKDLNEEQKRVFLDPEIRAKLKIIEYRESQEVIYQNRDFCIVSFGNDKCVLYTDMNNAKRGWISWREIDIGYYEAIREFIESGVVEKSDVNNYLESYKV